MTTRSIRRAAERKQISLSIGPKTQEGEAISSLNNPRHGLSGQFRILQSKNQAGYDHVLGSFREEHNQKRQPKKSS